ncbi:MAG TPA: nucleoside monophosphate kinase [Patescibacteria group bacterium]|nr:nucleoside monophosphate kinase [Patescibacteria group bacterium]
MKKIKARQMPNIVIMGPQGSGKGTQGEFLAKKLKIPKISTGDIYRDHIRRKTKLGVLTASIINKGYLMPNHITNAIMTKELQKSTMKRGFIVDGYPRNIVQAKALEAVGMPNFVILLTSTTPTIIKRISARRVCEDCKTIYHLKNLPPKKSGICDKCGGKLVQREDDMPQAIHKRLSIYKVQTKPLIARYKKMGILESFDGEKPIPVVQKEIMKELKWRKVL